MKTVKPNICSYPQPLADRLDDYVHDASLTTKKPNLTHFPPDFDPTPCKPLFFDLALSHLEFPSLEDRLEQKKTAQGGITGLVKGWLWGGKKWDLSPSTGSFGNYLSTVSNCSPSPRTWRLVWF